MNNISPCVACPNSSLGFCGAVLKGIEKAGSSSSESSAWQHHLLIPAGKLVVAPNQPLPDVYVLCNGWGIRFLQLPSGRRQIVSFLLPGDLFSASSVFEERFNFSVEALTAIQVSAMKRKEVQSRAAANPAVVMAVAGFCCAEMEAADRMMAVLGHFSAEERIAYLFLYLMKRIATQNVIRDHRYPFPLRQQHIADAVGLTPVHVSRILGTFRERRTAEVSNGVLQVFNLPELQRLGALN
jgi:CRP/FNR family transcriptional regulator, anaerobic regulatory protein